MKLSTEGFKWSFSKNATIWIVIIGVWVGSSILYQHQTQITPQAQATTDRNIFISSCASEALKYPSVNASAFCGCAYDRLLILYPDFATNVDRLNRIITQGYNQTETDMIVPCVSL